MMIIGTDESVMARVYSLSMPTNSTTSELSNPSPSPSNPVTDPTAVRRETTTSFQTIYREIADKMEALRHRRSQQNELTPIYQLPPELLEIIFESAITMCSRDPVHDNSPPLIWFNFSYVSQRWRNVALNIPRIWGVLLLNYPKWVVATLERSKEADLSIHWSHRTSSCLIEEIFEDLVLRIREFHLSIAGPWYEGLFLQFLKHNSLSLHTFRYINQFPDWTLSNRVPASKFSETYRMRCLDLRGCHIKWTVGAFPNLTHLRIHRSVIHDSFNQFLLTLTALPDLEVLDLNDSFPLPSTRTITTMAEISPEPVVLPKLHSLDLHSSTKIDELASFLPFLIIPSTTTINLSSEGTHYINTGSNIIPSFVSSDEYTSYKSLRIRCPNSGFIVEIWHDDAGMSGRQILCLFWSIPWMVRPPLPLYDLITLILHISISMEELIVLFGPLPALRNIVVSGRTVFDVIFALMYELPTDDTRLQSASRPVTFPALRSLSMLAIDCTGAVLVGTGVDLMLRCLSKRWERNASLDVLEISQCKDIDESHVKLLREVVDEVRLS